MTGVQTCALPISSDLTNILAGCVTFFKDRIWIGNINDSGTLYRYRIKWSSATDRTSFSAADYYDLPYSNGNIMRLVPFSNLLACYFTDALYLGRPSNYANLPLVFERYDTKGIGLVGTQAITDRKSTRLNSSHIPLSRMPSSA